MKIRALINYIVKLVYKLIDKKLIRVKRVNTIRQTIFTECLRMSRIEMNGHIKCITDNGYFYTVVDCLPTVRYSVLVGSLLIILVGSLLVLILPTVGQD